MPFRLGTNRIGRLIVGALPPAWNPADFTNVQYWWTADAGVTESGGVVSAWTDQINSLDYEQPSAGIRPTITTSSTLNNQNVIATNGTSQYMYIPSPLAAFGGSDLTILSVFNIVDVKTGGVITGVTGIGAGVTRVDISTVSGNIRALETNFGSGVSDYIQAIQTPASTGVGQSWKWRYDASAGNTFRALNTLTETAQAGPGTTNQTWGSAAVPVFGATLNSQSNLTVFGGRYVQLELAEQVFIYDTPTTQEMTDWKTYVNNKYGTIIS